jgi:hypothetical protein
MIYHQECNAQSSLLFKFWHFLCCLVDDYSKHTGAYLTRNHGYHHYFISYIVAINVNNNNVHRNSHDFVNFVLSFCSLVSDSVWQQWGAEYYDYDHCWGAESRAVLCRGSCSSRIVVVHMGLA